MSEAPKDVSTLKEMLGDADLSGVEGYAKALAIMGDPTAKRILEHGERQPYAPYDAERWGPKGRLKECFRNAWLLAEANPGELTYVEGYATSLAVCHHAWVIDPDGKVQDPTWRTPDDTECGYCLGDGIDPDTDDDCFNCGGTGESPDRASEWTEPDYLGIRFAPSEVAETMLKTGTFGVLGKEWMIR